MSKNFIFDWNIPRSEFETLAEDRRLSASKFITSCDAVVYEWTAHMIKNPNAGDKLHIFLKFHGGCAENIDNVTSKLQVLLNNKILTFQPAIGSYSCSTERKTNFKKCGCISKKECLEKYGLSDAQPLTLRFMLAIPADAFKYSLQFPSVEPAKQWVEKQFEDIEKPPSVDDGVFSDMQVEAYDGKIFYVNKVFFQYQSKALAVIIHRDGGESNWVKFSTLDSEALRALIKFLYLGIPYDALHTSSMICLLDAAEQYELAGLKDMCIALLWHRVVDKVRDLPEILRAADMYQLKSLKMRTLCVMVDNYEKINVEELSKTALQDIAAHAVARSRCRPVDM